MLEALASGVARPPDAFEEMIGAYRYPVYAWFRQRGHTVEEANDLTRRLPGVLAGSGVSAEGAAEGERFRTAVLRALGGWDTRAGSGHREWAASPGALLPLDAVVVEEKWQSHPWLHPLSAGEQFRHAWAATVVGRAVGRLRREWVADGSDEVCDALLPVVLGTSDRGVEASAIAGRLGFSERALERAIAGLRRHLAVAVRHEIADTVRSEALVDDELGCLS